jgi:hypothetical protein
MFDFLGFPWILSSESRLFKGLHGIFAQKIFHRALSMAWAPRPTGLAFGMLKIKAVHGPSLTLISDFLQSIVADLALQPIANKRRLFRLRRGRPA